MVHGWFTTLVDVSKKQQQQKTVTDRDLSSAAVAPGRGMEFRRPNKSETELTASVLNKDPKHTIE